MKRTLLFIGAAASIAFAALLLTDSESTTNFTPREEVSSHSADARLGDVDLKTLMNSDPATGRIDEQGRSLLAETMRTYGAPSIAAKSNAELDWISAGPDNQGGRTRAICSVPGEPNTVYTGSVTGGLFKSTDAGLTWERVESFNINNSISSIAITGTGNIYVATGSPFEGPDLSGSNINSGTIGDGVFVSTDNGSTFERLQDFYPQPAFSTDNGWFSVAVVKADPVNSNKLWICWDNGLASYTEGDDDIVPVTGVSAGNCRALSISDNGQYMLAFIDRKVYVSADSGASWTLKSSNGAQDEFGLINANSTGGGFRIELAVSPESPNYMYAVVVRGSRLHGAFASTDFGETWYRISSASSATSGFAPFLSLFGQGFYDCCLTVVPGEPTKCILGGVRVYMFNLTDEEPAFGTWDQINVQFTNGPNPFYVHSDIHTFHWNENNEFFIGTDGGVFKSLNSAQTFFPSNFQLRTTQFYGMGFNARGHVIGGTQDNGTHLVTGFNSSANNSLQIRGGDGYDSEMSQMDEDFMIGSIYYNDIARSFNGGLTFGQLVDSAGFPGPFYTTLRLHESKFNDDTQETFEYTLASNESYAAGQVISYQSPNLNYPLEYTTPVALSSGDMVDLPVYNTTLLAIGGTGGSDGMLLTLDATKEDQVAQFAFLGQAGMGTITAFDFSRNGDVLVMGNRNGNVYRVVGLRSVGSVEDIEALDVELISSGSGGYISDLSISPNNQNRMIFSRGGYTDTDKVFLTDDLMSADPSFTGIWDLPGELSRLPAYSILIDKTNNGRFIAGTEYGTWTSEDDGATWEECNTGMGRVPVFDLRQQLWTNTSTSAPDVLNESAIYAGTHGRGLFYNGDYILSSNDLEADAALSEISIFPNPMSEAGKVTIDLKETSSVMLEIFDINGKMVKRINQGRVNAGQKTINFDVRELKNGTYILNVIADDARRAGRFVIAD